MHGNLRQRNAYGLFVSCVWAALNGKQTSHPQTQAKGAVLSALQVLAIGETVEEVNDSGFLGSTPTLRTQLMADDSMLQVQLAAMPIHFFIPAP